MKRTILTAVVAALVTLGVALTAAAQTDLLSSLLGPVVVTIEQAVPVEITLATALEDGTVVTSTVPLTVGVSLAVTIDGDQVVAVAPADAGEAQVAVEAIPAGEELVDNSGIAYVAELAEGIVLLQLRTSEDYSDDFELVGEITNNTDDDLEYMRINLTLYDADGNILDTAGGYPDLQPLPEGRTSAFAISTSIPLDDVGSYRIQIEP